MSDTLTPLEIIRTHYPDAISTQDSVDRLFDLLYQRLGLEPRQIMLADSICSDDLNSIEYPKRAYEMLGPFKMGGLNGFPFTGLTGMGAFAHHVPEDGAVFVFYAPHIGVTRTGEVGASLRPGQSKPSACCGAAQGALQKLLSQGLRVGEVTELDYQMNTIEQIFLRQEERIRAAELPLMAATEVMYEAIEARIELLASKTSYPCRYLVLMGAILINGDHDMGSFTSVRRLQLTDLASGKKEDLLADYA